MIKGVMKQREQSWLGDSEIIVKHLGEQECQREMRRMGAQLQKGATEFIGYYICDHCDVAVEVRLRAHPDVPYELYHGSASTMIKEGDT